MSIYKIDSKNLIVPNKQSISLDSPKEFHSTKRDAAILSKEAQAQYRTEQMLNLDTIKQRINEGWYFRPEVRLQVAQIMLATHAV